MQTIGQQIIELDFPREEGASDFQDKALHIYYQDIVSGIERILTKHATDEIHIEINELIVETEPLTEASFERLWAQKVAEALELALINKLNGQHTAHLIRTAVYKKKEIWLRTFLQSGRKTWYDSSMSIQDIFNQLTEHPQTLTQVLLDEGKKENAVKRLVHQFSDKQFRTMVQVIEPTESDFILSSMDNLSRSQRKHRFVKTTESALQSAIKTVVLNYLIHDRGSLFNKRVFVQSLIRNTAQHYNMSYSQLLRNLVSVIPTTHLPDREKKFGLILQELLEAEPDRNTSETSTPEPQKGKEEKTHEVFDELKQYLRWGAVENPRTTRAQLQNQLVEWHRSSPHFFRKYLEQIYHRNGLYYLADLFGKPDEFVRFLNRINPHADRRRIDLMLKQTDKTKQKQVFVLVVRNLIRGQTQTASVEKALSKFKPETPPKDQGAATRIRLLRTIQHWSATDKLPWWIVPQSTFTSWWDSLNPADRQWLMRRLFLSDPKLAVKTGESIGPKRLAELLKQTNQEISGELIDLLDVYLKTYVSTNTSAAQILTQIVFRQNSINPLALLRELVNHLHYHTRVDSAEIMTRLIDLEYRKLALGNGVLATTLYELAENRTIAGETTFTTDRFLQMLRQDPVAARTYLLGHLSYRDVLQKLNKQQIRLAVHEATRKHLGYLENTRAELEALARRTAYPVDFSGVGFLYWLYNGTDKTDYVTAFIRFIRLKTSKPAAQIIHDLIKSAEGRSGLTIMLLKNMQADKQIVPDHYEAIPPVTPKHNEPEEHIEKTFIHNSGAVILWPFLQQYFTQLNLVDQIRFKDREAANRAVHLVQYLVTGTTGFPEYELILPKILCGVESDEPLHLSIEITDDERDLSESMLNAIIAHWSTLGETSIDGLRETFLKRQGFLYEAEDMYHLQVENKTFDVLLNAIPWNISIVKLPWMNKTIHVKWK